MNQKRLCKGHSKMLAGVCSGLAEYMGWDPTVVRIVTALLCLVWGTGLLLFNPSAPALRIDRKSVV